jgi:hypothetical protein
VEYVGTVTMQASKAVQQANQAHAAELSPYEYTIAAESLHKARELAGYARWQQALHFGEDAVKYGHDAEIQAREKAARPSEKHE